MAGCAEALFISSCAAAQFEQRSSGRTANARSHTERQTERSCYRRQACAGAVMRVKDAFPFLRTAKRGKRAKIDMKVSTSNTFSDSLNRSFAGERTLHGLPLYPSKRS